jgi:predicted phosphodiesterase
LRRLEFKTMTKDAVALISDIHGNIWALEAVLDDIRRRGIATTVNLGDSVYGPLEAAATADLLIESTIPSIRGNQDRVIIEYLPADPHPTLIHTRSNLLRKHFDWLRGQSSSMRIGRMFLCHGTPQADDVYLVESIDRSGTSLRAADEIDALIGAVAEDLVLCGHSHIPRLISLASGRTVLNPGSVGLPAYGDNLPVPHRMETGSPHARYAIVEEGDEGWMCSFVAVPYDWEVAAACARHNGREDWAAALETGYAAL